MISGDVADKIETRRGNRLCRNRSRAVDSGLRLATDVTCIEMFTPTHEGYLQLSMRALEVAGIDRLGNERRFLVFHRCEMK
jgi:hypothetical protein